MSSMLQGVKVPNLPLLEIDHSTGHVTAYVHWHDEHELYLPQGSRNTRFLSPRD